MTFSVPRHRNDRLPLFIINCNDSNHNVFLTSLLGRRQANICFHFAGSGENLPDIAKSCGASMDNKEFSSLLQILIKQNSFLF